MVLKRFVSYQVIDTINFYASTVRYNEIEHRIREFVSYGFSSKTKHDVSILDYALLCLSI